MHYRLRFILGFTIAAIATFGLWLCGLDFTIRGPKLGIAFVMVLVAFGLGFTCPLIEDNNDIR
jgi:hypothetical protein